MRLKITYACDWQSQDGDDQIGHVEIRTPTGTIAATWTCTGGMGNGCDLVSNSSTDLSDDEITELLDSPDLAQGLGTYEADLIKDDYGHYALMNVAWDRQQPEASAGN